MRQNNYVAGMRGQAEAEAHLVNKGYEILKKNYRLRSGEVDIIAGTGNYIVFVEVKYRKGLSLGYPGESVNAFKQRKIIKTAQHYIMANNLTDRDFRFDVIEVLESDGKTMVNHIEDAFWS